MNRCAGENRASAPNYVLRVNKMDGKLQFMTLLVICFVLCQTHGGSRSNGRIGKKCEKCPPGWGVLKKCVTDSNKECARCIPGRTYSPHYSSKSSCWSCSRCGVGLFESHGCSPVRDTICSECVSYLDHKNLTLNDNFSEKCAYLFL